MTIPVFSRKFQGSYQLVRELGRGGMGRVFEAVQVNLNRKVAIKVLGAEHFADAETRQRFVEEARILARVSHPNVVTLFDADLEAGSPYLVMEFIEGQTLRAILKKRGRLPLDEALVVAGGLLDGLAHLHDCGIAHRDLKPENILMEGDRLPRLVDFGLARSEGAARLTAAGFMVGTPMFMAPEQFAGREGGRPADIYAAGMLLFHMLTGQYPLRMGTGPELLPEKRNLTGDAIRRGLPGLPAHVSEAIVRCLAVNPEDRYESPLELLEQLGELAISARAPVVKRPPQRPLQATPAQPSLRPLRWLLAGVALAAGCAALLALLSWPMARSSAFRLRSLVLEARPGACRVRWSSTSPYPSLLVVAGKVHGGGASVTDHEVTVSPVPWAAPPEGRALLPDGSRSEPFRLSSLPVPLRCEAVRSGANLSLGAALPETSTLTVTVQSGDRTLLTTAVEASEQLSCTLRLPDALADYRMLIQSPGDGLLDREAQPVDLPGPVRQLTELLDGLKTPGLAEELGRTVRECRMDERRRRSAAKRLLSLLEKIHWPPRLAAARGAVAWALGPECADRALQMSVLRQLEVVRMFDQAALACGGGPISGAAAAMGPVWRSGLSWPPETAKSFQSRLPQPRKLGGAATSEINAYFQLGPVATRLDFVFALPDPSGFRQAWVTARAGYSVPEGLLMATLNPGTAGEVELLLFHDATDRPREAVSLTHAFPPGLLRPGNNLVRLSYSALPGAFATSVSVESVALALE